MLLKINFNRKSVSLPVSPPPLPPQPPPSIHVVVRVTELQFGTVTLGEHYERIAVEGNDYDPYTTLFARNKKMTTTASGLLGSTTTVG